MTSDELTRAVALAVPAAHTNQRETVADTFIGMAVSKLNRLKDVDINQVWEEFTLTSGQSSYKIGVDILSDGAWNVQNLCRTDVPNWPINVVDRQEFTAVARGGTNTGPPTVATVHSKDPILEVYPIPNSNYAVGAFIRVNISGIDDIDERYYDVVYTTAIELIGAAGSPEIARMVGAEGRHEMTSDTLTGWDGTIIPLRRNIGQAGQKVSADSGNLRP